MRVTTEDCKKAIVAQEDRIKHICANDFQPPEDSAKALEAKNWKRRSKLKVDAVGDYGKWSAKALRKIANNGGTMPPRDEGVVLREFDCAPYEDQLRADVWEREGEIALVRVQAE